MAGASSRKRKRMKKEKITDVEIPPETKGELSEDLGYLLKSGKYVDFTITVKNEKFAVHKWLLAVRSSVFEAMFKEGTVESRTNETTIDDLDPLTAKNMLEFIYTDKVLDLKKHVKGLLFAADKYDLVKLKDLCDEALRDELDVDNAAELLILADLHHAEKLREDTLEFMADYLSEVVKTDAYKNMVKTYVHLLKPLVDKTALIHEQKRLEKEERTRSQSTFLPGQNGRSGFPYSY